MAYSEKEDGDKLFSGSTCGVFSDKPTFWYEVIVLEGGFVPKSLSIETQSG